MAEYIFDRFRQRYQIEVQEDSDQTYYIKMKDGADYAGQLLCSYHENGVMILEDLFIRNDFERDGDWAVDRKLRPEIPMFEDNMVPGDPVQPGRRHPRETDKNYRNKGLGSALLRIMTALALRRGMTTIFGSIVKMDLARNPNLIRWYLNRAFTLTDPFPGCIPGARAYIRFNVPSVDSRNVINEGKS
jgi:GNAT superfamily N-acetyltransferase